LLAWQAEMNRQKGFKEFDAGVSWKMNWESFKINPAELLEGVVGGSL
jgi:hypothetical protein